MTKFDKIAVYECYNVLGAYMVYRQANLLKEAPEFSVYQEYKIPGKVEVFENEAGEMLFQLPGASHLYLLSEIATHGESGLYLRYVGDDKKMRLIKCQSL